jgi:type I restriction enzyme S subunit
LGGSGLSFETWKTVALEDVLEALIDYRGKTPKKTNSGIPLITAKIVKNGVVQHANEFISEKDYDSWMVRGFPRIGDVVLTTEAPLGEVAQLKNDKVALAQRIVTLRGKEKVLDNGFLKYFLMSSLGQSRLKEKESGTTVTGIKQSELRRVKIDIPNFETQQVISKILSSLDDKIELNNAINKNLEEMAQALFKRWFVDFEFPNENGEPYKSSGGEFVESELGLIPKGWKVCTLGEFCEISTTSINPATLPNIIFEHYSLPAFDNGKLPVFESGYGIKSNKYKVSKNSILVSKLNPETKRVWNPYCLTDYAICSTEFMNYVPINSKLRAYCFSILNSEGFYQYLVGNTTGSTNSRQRVSPRGTLHYKFAYGGTDTAYTFNDLVSTIYKKINENTLENKYLASIRDTLLPKLMSGELRVPVEQDHNAPDLPMIAESSAIYQP